MQLGLFVDDPAETAEKLLLVFIVTGFGVAGQISPPCNTVFGEIKFCCQLIPVHELEAVSRQHHKAVQYHNVCDVSLSVTRKHAI